MRFKFFSKIRIKMQILVAVIAISGLLLFVLFSMTRVVSRTYNEKQSSRAAQQATSLMASSLNNMLKNVENIWSYLAVSDEFQEYYIQEKDTPSWQALSKTTALSTEYLEKFIISNAILESIICYPSNGGAFSAGRINTALLKDYLTFPEYQKSLTSGARFEWFGQRDFEGSYFMSTVDNLMGVSRAVRRYDNQQTVGTLEVHVNQESILEIFKAFDIEGNGVVGLFDTQGHFLLGNQLAQNYTDDFSEIFSQLQAAESNKYFLAQEEYFFCSNTLQNGWQLVYGQPMNDLLQASQGQEKVILLISIVLSIFCVTLAYIIANFIVSPLYRFFDVMHTHSSSNGEPALSLSRNADIQYLYDNYNYIMRRMKEQELETLRAQISPHFLYNTLNSIKCRAYLDGSAETAKMTEALILLLQMSISHKKNLILLSEEIAMIKGYLLLQESRTGAHIATEYKVCTQVQSCLVPKMILQPLIENSIFHGFSEMESDMALSIFSWVESEQLMIALQDNGCGMSTERIRLVMRGEIECESGRVNHIGIHNVDERLKITFGKNYGLTLFSIEGEGAIALLKMPIYYEDPTMHTETEV